MLLGKVGQIIEKMCFVLDWLKQWALTMDLKTNRKQHGEILLKPLKSRIMMDGLEILLNPDES